MTTLATLLVACGGGGGGGSPPAPTLSSIAVTPATPSVTRGSTQQFTATGTYSDGSTNNLTASVTWLSSSTSIATIASSGLASAVAVGTTTISASSGNVSGSATLTVTPPTLTSIAVTPATPSIAKGRTQQFTATGTYSDNTTSDITTQVTWSAVDTTIATIASGGLATGVNAGTTTVRAAQGTVSGSTTLTVTAPVLISLAVTPATSTLTYQGAIQQLRAIGTYSDQSTADLTNSATWSSSNASVATIGSDGFVTAVANSGSSTLTAQAGAFNATANVTVQTATVSGTISIPDADMGWKPGVGDFVNNGAGGKVRVLGTNISADVVVTGNYTGTFSLTGVPMGNVTLVFDEGSVYDVFTAASKRVVVNVANTSVAGVTFDFVYHWRELAGYPPPWGTNNSQGPVSWKAQFVSENIAFIAFRRDVPSERIELWRTTDRGANWTQVGLWIFNQSQWDASQPYPVDWEHFYFLDANRGVVPASYRGIPCDSGGAFFQTGDGGQNWNARPMQWTPSGYHLEALTFARIGSDHIVLVGSVGCGVQGYSAGFYDAIWESPDAGVTWQLKWNSARDVRYTFIGVDANSNGRALAAFGSGTPAFMLRDAQGNWISLANTFGIRDDSRDIAMVGDTAWILSSGGSAPNGFYRSLNAGSSWSQISSGTPQDFDFATQLKGFAQAGGPAYVTYDAGATWRYQSAGGAIWPGVMDIWAFDRTHAAWAEVGFGDPNQRAQLFTYVEPVQASVEVVAESAPASATVGRGATNNIMAAYVLRNNGPVPASIQSITLRASGSANDASGIAAVKLWRDNNGDGNLDSGDTQLGSATIAADDGTAVFPTGGLSTLEQMHAVRLLVTYDLAGAGTYSGTFRYALTAADISAKDAESPAAITVTLPGNVALTSRTLTVSP